MTSKGVPTYCRQRLRLEGSPYPRSRCHTCGPLSPRWKECDAALAEESAKPTPVTDPSPVEPALKVHVGIIGHLDRSKQSLTAAITKLAADEFNNSKTMNEPAQGGEAVGEIDAGEEGMFAFFYPDRDLPLGAKLYTTPPDQSAELARVTACLKIANANHEEFERKWYLEKDRAERAEAERDALRARLDRTIRILCAIYEFVDPPPITINGARHVFSNPRAQTVLRELSARIRRIPDELAAIDAARNQERGDG